MSEKEILETLEKLQSEYMDLIKIEQKYLQKLLEDTKKIESKEHLEKLKSEYTEFIKIEQKYLQKLLEDRKNF